METLHVSQEPHLHIDWFPGTHKSTKVYQPRVQIGNSLDNTKSHKYCVYWQDCIKTIQNDVFGWQSPKTQMLHGEYL